MEAFRSNVPKFFTNEEICMYENFLERIGKEYLPKGAYYVLEYDGKIVGAGGYGPQRVGDKLTLIWGLVHNAYHKKGLGKALLAHRVAAFQKEHPQDTLWLDTTQYSYPFFEKYGFVVTEFTEDYYEKGMHRYDMVYQLGRDD